MNCLIKSFHPFLFEEKTLLWKDLIKLLVEAPFHHGAWYEYFISSLKHATDCCDDARSWKCSIKASFVFPSFGAFGSTATKSNDGILFPLSELCDVKGEDFVRHRVFHQAIKENKFDEVLVYGRFFAEAHLTFLPILLTHPPSDINNSEGRPLLCDKTWKFRVIIFVFNEQVLFSEFFLFRTSDFSFSCISQKKKQKCIFVSIS